LILLMILALAVAGALRNTSGEEVKHSKTKEAPQNQSQTNSETAQFSIEQQGVVEKLGPPEAFKIMIQHDPNHPTRAIRHEIWDYYTLERRIVFINGEFSGDDPIDAVPDVILLPIMFRPEQFISEMSFEEVEKSIIQDRPYQPLPIPNDYLEDAWIVGLEQLILGFEKDKLTYVESIPLTSNAGESE